MHACMYVCISIISGCFSLRYFAHRMFKMCYVR